ncbi:uncharacterized protein LOC143909812 isoform X2 [Arctopsyche grandis]|uniref:uncharacterized protein LOC143909812 isoform X2 n=1 Tax=Arctopsyche grandis TaxID=121162 RepID=UPI00406D6AD4
MQLALVFATMDTSGNASGSNSSNGQGAGEVVELRRELANVHRALRIQSEALARQQQKTGDLTLKLASHNSTAAKRLQARDQQLTALLHALFILEAKLKREQKQINQQLHTKNVQLQLQREQIKKLKQDPLLKNSTYCRNCQHLIGSTSEQTNIETDPEFHSLDSVESHNPNNFERSLSFQEKQQQHFQKNSRLSKSFQLPKSELVNHDNTSSSEEVFESSDACFNQAKGGTYVKNKQAFVRKDVTRRSRKFSGRKHSSAYLDTVQKRQSNRSQVSSSSAEDGAQSEKDSKFRLNEDCSNYDIGEEITKDIERASNRIDELLNASQSSEKTILNDSVQLRLHKNIHREESLSKKIDNLHGIRKQPLSERLSFQDYSTSDNFESKSKKQSNADIDKPWYTNSSDPEPELECHYAIKKEKLNRYRCKSADDILVATFNDTVMNDAMAKIPSEYLPTPTNTCRKTKSKSKSSNDNTTNRKDVPNNSNSKLVNGSFESGNKFDNEPSENWYASASDQDEDQTCEIYKNNPVLECVNQILLQNSLDESTTDNPRPHESASPKASTKRVQFSTLNSISFEEHVKRNGEEILNKSQKDVQRSDIRRSNNKIVKFSLETASEHSYEIPTNSEGFNYEVQSIYSNDYEPIITKPCNIPISNMQKSKLKPVPLPRSINSVNKVNDGSKKVSVVKNMAMSLENKMNANHYVDMEIKVGNSQVVTMCRRKVPRVPPALPPKPKNLVSKFKLNSALPTTTPLLNSETVESIQRKADVPNSRAKHDSVCGSTKSSVGTEPDYCSISEINVPVVSAGKRSMIHSQTSVEIHAEQFSPNIAERRPTIIPKMATISKIAPNRQISDKDIPKLPQVTEIIIPEDDEVKESSPPRIQHDNYPMNSSQHVLTNNKIDNRNSIQMGHSISSILTDIKNRSASMQDVNKCMLLPEHNMKQYATYGEYNYVKSPDKTKLPTFEVADNECEKFDLSQNFEEFKIDDCEFNNMSTAEEYKIGSSDGGSTDSTTDDTNTIPESVKSHDTTSTKKTECLYKIEFTAEDDLKVKKIGSENYESFNKASKLAMKNFSKMSNKPDLLSNIDSVETDSVRYSDLESSNSSSSNCGSYNTVKCEPAMFAKDAANANQTNGTLPFEYFLESSGLSSKSILTPSRPPSSNHKNVLKPKDVKMRSKNTTSLGRVTPLYEKCTNTAIKYIEPYL